MYDKNRDARKRMKVSIIVFVSMLMIVLFCYCITSFNAKRGSFFPYYLVRVFLFPTMFMCLGYCLAKLAIYFWDIPQPVAKRSFRYVRTFVLVLLGINIVVIAPYIILYLYGLGQLVLGNDLDLRLPYIRVYSMTAAFLLNSVMYKTSIIYSVPGFFLGLIPQIKKKKF